MRLTIQDGPRQVTIVDRKTAYSPDVLADWTRQAGALLAAQDYGQGSTHPAALVERAEQFDHDRRQPRRENAWRQSAASVPAAAASCEVHVPGRDHPSPWCAACRLNHIAVANADIRRLAGEKGQGA